jgi:DNA invertase Pin-like site-specific DNA recombinase
MKKEVLRLGLPVLLRKWDKINLDQISNREIEGLVLELHQKGVSRKEIASRLKINLDSLSKIFTRNGFYLRNIKNKKVGKWCDLNKNNPENNKDLITD